MVCFPGWPVDIRGDWNNCKVSPFQLQYILLLHLFLMPSSSEGRKLKSGYKVEGEILSWSSNDQNAAVLRFASIILIQ